ncbi:hypothetical protein [Herbidospora daliensis]|uniref:hypothetical protein n=1 Tax=Herbidospora daliensis TaxID=295585 RepID=UPI0012F7C2C4|nr:hypothetical protein [Herbidospora daliensis]
MSSAGGPVRPESVLGFDQQEQVAEDIGGQEAFSDPGKGDAGCGQSDTVSVRRHLWPAGA